MARPRRRVSAAALPAVCLTENERLMGWELKGLGPDSWVAQRELPVSGADLNEKDSGCHEHNEADYRARINPNQANVLLRLIRMGWGSGPTRPASTQDLGGALVQLWMGINAREAHQKDSMANVCHTQSQ